MLLQALQKEFWSVFFPCIPVLCVQAPVVGQVQCLSGLFFLEASLMAQTVKHLPAMWETWVRSLGQEDPLEKEMATHSTTLG